MEGIRKVVLNRKFKDKEWKPGLIRYLRSMDEGGNIVRC
jgi:hypothetical protein